MPLAVAARPYGLMLDPAATALVVIDMQRDFLEPGGFGELLGNDVSLLTRVVQPLAQVLSAARRAGILVIHTREGHRPDLCDCPPSKLARGRLDLGIGGLGPRGRVLVRGEEGHDIVHEGPQVTNSRRSTAKWCWTSPARAASTRLISRRCCATSRSRA